MLFLSIYKIAPLNLHYLTPDSKPPLRALHIFTRPDLGWFFRTVTMAISTAARDGSQLESFATCNGALKTIRDINKHYSNPYTTGTTTTTQRKKIERRY